MIFQDKIPGKLPYQKVLCFYKLLQISNNPKHLSVHV